MSNNKKASYNPDIRQTKPASENSPRIPVIRTPIKNLGLKSPYLKHLESKLRPPNKIVQDTNLFRLPNKVSNLPPLESPMGKEDDMEALEEFEHPVINEKDKYENSRNVHITESTTENTIEITTTEYISQLDKDDLNYTTTVYRPATLTTDTVSLKVATTDVNTDALRDRTDSEDELIKETVMLFLSDMTDETLDLVLPGQTDIIEDIRRNKIDLIRKPLGSYTPEITVNKGILKLITENMIIKVRVNKLIGYIAGARNESIILIFKKNNITVPIKNKSGFKELIVLLDEILSKRGCCFWPF